MAAPASLGSLLRQPPYRRLWMARTVSQWGDAFNTVALALLVYSLTGSGLGVSAVVVAEIIPVLALPRWPVRWSTGYRGLGDDRRRPLAPHATRGALPSCGRPAVLREACGTPGPG
ncbi:MAG: hypothetical protein M3R63_16715 [Actinomycetota bacterium]|nr:hypothetical protein [Actinomycetota bacterium]